MKLIIITHPDFIENEAEAINRLFEAGLETLHLRKPESTQQELSSLINRIRQEYHNRIVLHDHFTLCGEFNIKGLHLNRRNSIIPDGFNGQISASCHSINEASALKDKFDYIFLSPIFDSISKEGYLSNFTEEEIRKAKESGIIDKRVYALGGIETGNINIVKDMGFGGAAVLGCLWNEFTGNSKIECLIEQFSALKQECDKQY